MDTKGPVIDNPRTAIEAALVQYLPDGMVLHNIDFSTSMTSAGIEEVRVTGVVSYNGANKFFATLLIGWPSPDKVNDFAQDVAFQLRVAFGIGIFLGTVTQV